jgi:hypothetical protein
MGHAHDLVFAVQSVVRDFYFTTVDAIQAQRVRTFVKNNLSFFKNDTGFHVIKLLDIIQIQVAKNIAFTDFAINTVCEKGVFGFSIWHDGNNNTPQS